MANTLLKNRGFIEISSKTSSFFSFFFPLFFLFAVVLLFSFTSNLLFQQKSHLNLDNCIFSEHSFNKVLTLTRF